MTPTTQQLPNGVDVEALHKTREAIRQTPTVAAFRFRARNRWLNGPHNRTTIDEYSGACQEFARAQPFVFDNDEPPVLLGQDRGANPVEYLLHALAGCVTTTVVYHAAARGILLEEVESTLEGDIDLHGMLALSDDPAGYRGIRMTFHIQSPAPREQVEELLRSVAHRSPVFSTVTRPVPVEVKLA